MVEPTFVTGSSLHRVTLSDGAAVAATKQGTHALHTDIKRAAGGGTLAPTPETLRTGTDSHSTGLVEPGLVEPGLVEQLRAIHSAAETHADDPWKDSVMDAILARMKALKQTTDRLRSETVLLTQPSSRPQDTGSNQ